MAIARRTQRPHITLLRRLRDTGTLYYKADTELRGRTQRPHITGVGACKARGPRTTIYELYLRLVSPKKYADWCSVKSKSAT